MSEAKKLESALDSKVVVGGPRRGFLASLKGPGLIVLGLVIIAGVILVTHHVHSRHDIASGSVCNNNVIKQSDAGLKVGNLTAVQQVVQSVKSHTGYKQDPNCLYIITQYQLLNDQANLAAQTISQLQRLDPSSKGLSKQFIGGQPSIDALQAQLQALRRTDQEQQGQAVPNLL